MPVAVIYSEGGSTTTNTEDSRVTTGSLPSGSNRVAYLWTYYPTQLAATATLGGNAMTAIATTGQGRLWRLVNPPTGAQTLVIGNGAAYTPTLYSLIVLSGVDTTTPNGTVVSASGTSTAASSGSVTVPSDGMAIGFVRAGYIGPTTLPAIVSPSTLRGAGRDGGSGHQAAGGSRTTTGSVAWTLAESTSWGAVGVPVNGIVVPLTITGSLTLDDITASGTLADAGPTLLSGTLPLGGITATGSLGLQPGAWQVNSLTNWSGALQASVTIPWISFCRLSDGVQVLVLANQTTNAAGTLNGTNAALVPGTWYMVTGWNADGSQRFATPVLAG